MWQCSSFTVFSSSQVAWSSHFSFLFSEVRDSIYVSSLDYSISWFRFLVRVMLGEMTLSAYELLLSNYLGVMRSLSSVIHNLVLE